MSSFVCPLEFRYGRKEMRAVFEENFRLAKLLLVEASLAKAQAELGIIPKKDAEAIAKAANTTTVTLKRVKEIEDEIKHDIMALVRALAEASGDAGKYIHLGATSSDILDTATALQLKEALPSLRASLESLRFELLNLAVKYKKTVMLGRTHGQAAVPTTFGYKMAVFALEVHRHLKRLEEASKRILVGKMSGAVGTGASFGEHALALQKLVMEDLDLGVEEGSTQIVARDRYAELILLLAGMAASIEKFATEIRNLLRSDIQEVEEGFDEEKQVGSSTMAHKKNPILAENICGLARIVRGYVYPALENVPTWHERDLTNSSSERFIIPHALILADDIAVKMTRLLRNLKVNEDMMLENIKRTKGLIMSESVMLALAEKGMGRQDAHELVRKLAMKCRAGKREFRDVLLEDDTVKGALNETELDKALDPHSYLGAVEEIIDQAVKVCKS